MIQRSRWIAIRVVLLAAVLGGLVQGQGFDNLFINPAEAPSATEARTAINTVFRQLKEELGDNLDRPLPRFLVELLAEVDSNLFPSIALAATHTETMYEGVSEPDEADPTLFCGDAEGARIARGIGGGNIASYPNPLFPSSVMFFSWQDLAFLLEAASPFDFDGEMRRIAIIDDFTTIVDIESGLGISNAVPPFDDIEQAVSQWVRGDHPAVYEEQLARTSGLSPDLFAMPHGRLVVYHLLNLLRPMLLETSGQVVEDFRLDTIGEVPIFLLTLLEPVDGNRRVEITLIPISFGSAGEQIGPLLDITTTHEYDTVNLSWSFIPCEARQFLLVSRTRVDSYSYVQYIYQLGRAAEMNCSPCFQEIQNLLPGDLVFLDSDQRAAFAAIMIQALYQFYFENATTGTALDGSEPEVIAASGNQGLDFALIPAGFPEVTCVTALASPATFATGSESSLFHPRSHWANAGEIALPGGYFPLFHEAPPPIEGQPFYAGTTFSSLHAALLPGFVRNQQANELSSEDDEGLLTSSCGWQ